MPFPFFNKKMLTPCSYLLSVLSHSVCLTLYNPMNCSAPDSSLHGIFQTRILEQVAISYSRGSSKPRNQTCISCVACIVRCTAPPGNHSPLY